MPDSHDKPSDDHERMQQYLEWRERTDRTHRAVRRRARRRGAVVAVGLAVVALSAWLMLGPRAWRETASRDASESPTAGVAAPSSSSEPLASPALERPPASATAPAPRAAAERDAQAASERAPRATAENVSEPNAASSPRTAPERPASVRRSARSAATQHVPGVAAPPRAVESSDVVANATKSDAKDDRAEVATPNTAATAAATSTDRTPPVMSSESTGTASAISSDSNRTTPPTPNDAAPVQPPPNTDVAAVSPHTPPATSSGAPALSTPSPVDQPTTTDEPGVKRTCSDVMTADGGIRGRSQRAIDCAGRWLKGEADEFRDGVKRQVETFRTGLDKVGRGLQSLGDKLRRP